MTAGIKLDTLEKHLLSCPTIKQHGFHSLKLHVMRKNKKGEYWGTSVKRYVSETTPATGKSKQLRVSGKIYINFKDITSLDKLLRVVAEEAGHLLDDQPHASEQIYQYLKEVIGEP